MTDQLQAMQQQIVAAVQEQLTQYSQQVAAEVQRLRDEIVAERTARTNNDEQLRSLAAGLERAGDTNASFQGELQRALEERLTEFGTTTKRRHEEVNKRLDSVVDEANIGLAAAVESATRPILRQVEHRQDKVETDVATLDKSLRKFDDQAARMVAHINDVTGGVESRLTEMSIAVNADVEGRVSGLSARLDEVSAQAARQQSEVANVVGQRVDEAEARLNDKIATASARINEEVGTRVADIDAYLGRVSVGLDEGIVMLNDRIAEVNGRFEQIDEQIAAMERSIKEVDAEALDEMKEKVNSAAGEAMLVRIEMERFQATMTESVDKTSVRITEVETQLQDQALDTEAAVQLERLEEVERALIALDPAQFVRVGGANNSTGYPSSEERRADEEQSDTDDSQISNDYGSDASMAPPSAPLSPPTGHNPTDSMASLAPPANATN